MVNRMELTPKIVVQKFYMWEDILSFLCEVMNIDTVHFVQKEYERPHGGVSTFWNVWQHYHEDFGYLDVTGAKCNLHVCKIKEDTSPMPYKSNQGYYEQYVEYFGDWAIPLLNAINRFSEYLDKNDSIIITIQYPSWYQLTGR